MQAIAETLFDIVYLTTVITLGVLHDPWIARAVLSSGCSACMAVVLGAGDSFHLVPRARGSVHHRPGKLHRCPGHRQAGSPR